MGFTGTNDTGAVDPVDTNGIQTPDRADLRSKLAELPLLAGIDWHLLDTIGSEFEWFSLPGGQTLFHEGDTDDSLYILLSGRLGAFVRNEDGKDTLIRQMVAGETVGEMALLSGEPRSATVVTLRDSELLQLRKPAFTRLIEAHPKALRFITDLLVRRLREPRSTGASQAPKTIAVISLAPVPPSTSFVRSLEKAFVELGTKTCVLDNESSSRPIEWFNALEEAFGMVLYQADFEPSAWSQLCLRQADRLVLLVHNTQHLNAYSSLIESILQDPRRTPCELVLLHDGDRIAGSTETATLLKRFDALMHNVRAGVPRDFRRLARQLSGRAVGLVLSGGGARGLSHIGVIRALREAGMELDLFGGASIGAVVAAGAALEWDNQELSEHMRAAFSDANPTSDYILPMISLVRGRKASRFLRQHFGEHQIEDCPCPYFNVSTNLSTGRLKVHRTGPIWRTLRASTAIPGVLSPVVDGSEILVDGGVLNNLPFEIMREMHRGQIVAVDVTRDRFITASIDELDHRPLWQLARHARRGTPNIFTLLVAAGSLSGMLKPKSARQSVDLLIEPPISNVGMLDWKLFDSAVEAGYQCTMEILEKDWLPTRSIRPSHV
jgi:NTE family protein